MSKKNYDRKQTEEILAAKKQAAEDKMTARKPGERKRMKPAARNLLLTDLVFLALVQILVSTDVISSGLADTLTLIGAVLVLVAVGIQMVGGSGRRKGA